MKRRSNYEFRRAKTAVAQTLVFSMFGKKTALEVLVSPSKKISDFGERWKHLFCRAKSMSSIFEDASSESIVFVVPESRLARNVFDLSSGMAKVSPNHCVRSVSEPAELKVFVLSSEKGGGYLGGPPTLHASSFKDILQILL